ncbi:hypothetical protein FQN57_000680 [Myotisia sp. PD_48]|nr:hypothetical protein FQN57_000680 [Myotisia sp. PD_48]
MTSQQKTMQAHSDPEPQSVLIEKTPEGITSIAINRPGKKNAINPPTAKKLHQAFLDFEQDPSQKVAIFYGTGGTFCSGFDLTELAKWEKPSSPNNPSSGSGRNTQDTITGSYFQRVQGRNQAPLGPARMQIEKPVVCAISGHAVAGGTELSLLGDIRVVEEDAIFGIFNRRLGVPLLDGGTVRLQAVIGLGRALDILLTGRAVGAKEAVNIGLATKVVAKGESYHEAMKIAKVLASYPQEGLNVDRKSCYNAAYDAHSFQDAISYEFDGGVRVSDLAITKAMKFKDSKVRQSKL